MKTDDRAMNTTPKGSRARQAKADALATSVRALAKQYEAMGLNMPAKVAEDLKISARAVREILATPPE
jgi:hypothetical protein